jgi:hypothetical protein
VNAVPCQYDAAGPWDNGIHCGTEHLPGSKALGQHLTEQFGGRFEGFDCRPNTARPSEMSVHGTGRAVDFYPPDKATGDRVAAACLLNQARWGIQLVIWFRRDWMCAHGWTDYSGPNPHVDHLHIEQTIEAAERVVDPDWYDEGGLSMADIDQILSELRKLDRLRDEVGAVREAQRRARETQLRQTELLRQIALGAAMDPQLLDDVNTELDRIRADIFG